MRRVFAWGVFVLVLAGLVKLVGHMHNPWASDNFKPRVTDAPQPSAAAVFIPGCKETGGCS